MAATDAHAPWTCANNIQAADLVSVDLIQSESETAPPLLFAVWQPMQIHEGRESGMCGARSRDAGRSWEPTEYLHVRRTSAADGSNQQAPVCHPR